MDKKRKAGPITLALGMIVFGVILLVSNINGYGALDSVLKFWPVLLVMLGLEYFIISYLNRSVEDDNNTTTRFHLPTVFIILLAALVGYTGQQVNGLVKDTELHSLISEAVAGSNYNYERVFESKAISIKPGITKIAMDDNFRGKVELVPSNDGKIHVTAHILGWGYSEKLARERTELVKLRVDEGDTVNIRCNSAQAGNVQRQTEVSLRIMIPQAVDAQIYTEAGSITAKDMAGNLQVRLRDGETEIMNIKGNVSFEGQSGQAVFKNIGGGLETQLRTGSMLVKDVQGKALVSLEDGQLEVESTKPVLNNYKIVNKNGEIALRIPTDSNTSIVAETQHGSISGSLELKAESREPGSGAKATAVLGAGKGVITIQNDNGSITVDKQ